MLRFVSSSVVLFLLVSCTGAGGAGGDNQPGGVVDTCETPEGVTFIDPQESAVQTDGDGGDVDISCVGNPVDLPASNTTTLQGCIDVFGLGGEAVSGIKVSVFTQDEDPKEGTPIDTVDVAIDDDVGPGLACDGEDADDPACLAVGCDKKGYYRVEGVPTNVPVRMRIEKPGDNSVIPTYIWDVVFADEDVVDGRSDYEAALIYQSTYNSIPTVGGRLVDGQQNIGDGQGRGVIAGEIHDCSDTIIQGATVTSDQVDASTKIDYFNGNDADPSPDLRRVATNSDGLYVILNATTDDAHRDHVVSAAIREPGCTNTDCQCVSLSSRTVRVYPDSVSIVTLRGDLPQ